MHKKLRWLWKTETRFAISASKLVKIKCQIQHNGNRIHNCLIVYYITEYTSLKQAGWIQLWFVKFENRVIHFIGFLINFICQTLNRDEQNHLIILTQKNQSWQDSLQDRIKTFFNYLVYLNFCHHWQYLGQQKTELKMYWFNVESFHGLGNIYEWPSKFWSDRSNRKLLIF